MRLRTAAFATGAALALAALPVMAHAFGHRGHGPGRDGPGLVAHMAQELGLSDSQTTQLEAIAAKHREGALSETGRSMREARRTLRRTIHDTAATDDQVRDAAAALATLETQAAVLRHRMVLELSAILTPEQKAKLEERLAGFDDKRGGGHHCDRGGF